MKLKFIMFLEIIIAIIALISGIVNFYVGFEIIGFLNFFCAIFCAWAWFYNFLCLEGQKSLKIKRPKRNYNYGKH